jgi:ubiquinone/menaquinone biosynthesis C-methylase UbiE
LGAARLPAVRFFRARAQALPFADQSMNTVLCHMALMLMDEPDVVLQESRRVLRPGGVFGAVTNRPTAPDAIVQLVLGALRDALRAGDASRRPPSLGDPRTRDASALTRLFESHFTDVTTQTFTVAQLVSRVDLWSFMVQSIYGLDAITDEEGTRILARLALPDPVRWTVPMVQVHGRVPTA